MTFRCWIAAVTLGAGVLTARADLAPALEAMSLAREASAAAEAKDLPTYLAKMEQAVALRPDFPRMLVDLAAAQVANGRNDDAIATLTQLAALGVTSSVERSADFTALKEHKEFKSVAAKLAVNLRPVGRGEIAFSLREVTGLIEGIAWRPKDGAFFFGDVNGRAVWIRTAAEAKDGKPRRFTPEGDKLLGVFGLAVDEANGVLWAATAATSAMRGFLPEQDGEAALAEIDLETGAVRRVIPVVRKAGDRFSHVLGDLGVGVDGTVFVTDSGGPLIWRLPPGGAEIEPWVQSDYLMSGQGIVVTGDGRALLVADHANGLLRIDIASRDIRLLAPPVGSTLIGLDGLVLASTGEVIAIQNGLKPNRLLRISLDAPGESITSVTVLESGHMAMAAPSLGCIATAGELFFIGNAGWTRFENTDGQPSLPRTVPVFKTKL